MSDEIVLFDGYGRNAEVKTQRSFEGAKFNRLTADWITSQTSLDADLRWSLKTLINRARWFEQNDAYGESYLKLIERNVVGPEPFRLQMKVRDPDGAHDKAAEAAIESAWEEWGKPRNCCVDGASLFDAYKICARSMVRDGGHLIRKYRGMRYGPYRFQLENLDIDFLDPDYNVELKDGSRIVMSVELDRHGKPVAYHLLGNHPGDIYWTSRSQLRSRVSANDIVHPYIRKRSNQRRGFTEFAAIMPNIRQFSGYRDSVIVNARTSAAKMGFFTKGAGENARYVGANAETGGKYMDAEPGAMEELPQGLNFEAWDPKQPTTGYAEFSKEVLRSNAAGLGVAYMNLANDPGDANFSSARVGVVEEREGFKMLQKTMIEHVCLNIFEDWLFTALTASRILDTNNRPLPVSKFKKFNNPHFRGRRWQWLDPKNDSEAAAKDIEMGITSVADVVGERGGDEEEVLDEIEQTLDRRAKAGLVGSERLESMRLARSIEEQEQAEKKEPLISSIGTGGVQGVVQVVQTIAAGGMSEEAGVRLLVSVFGFSEDDAKVIAAGGITPTAENNP